MKTTRKLTTLLLALVMLFTLAIGASAATVTNNTTGHSYDAYQIFSGTQAADSAALGQVDWGSGVDGDALLTELQSKYDYFDDCTSAADVADVLAGKTDNCDEAKALANAAANHLTTTKTSIAADAKDVTLEAGYYLLVDTTSLDTVDAHNNALLQVTNKGEITIAKKYSVPVPDKKIVEGQSKVDATTKSIGDTVTFELQGTLPENYADYDLYKFVFHDDMSDGLTFDGADTVNVYLGTSAGYTEQNKITTGYTVTTTGLSDGCDLEIAFADLKTIATVTKDTVIYVTYTATLNDEAVIDTANPNKVKLEYSNNPNFDADPDDNPDTDNPTPPTGFTTEEVVNVYTTQVTIVKKDGTTQAVLPGAAFKITGTSANIVVTSGKVFVAYGEDETAEANNKYWELTDGTFTATDPTGEDVDTSKYADQTTVYKLVTKASLETKGDKAVEAEGFVDDTTGKLTFAGLGVGTYTIEETVVPAGYNKAENLTLTIGYENDAFTYSWSGGATGSTAEVTVFNNAGSTLPETGGVGTTMFYVIGGALVLAAVVLLVTKKRMTGVE